MRGEQNRVAFRVQLADEGPQGLPQLYVHAGGRFVEHDHGRTVHQRLRDQHAPLHAAGELAHVVIGLVGEREFGQQFVYPLVQRCAARDTEVAGLKAQCFAH